MIFLYSLKNISWPTSIQVRLVNKVVCFCFSSFEAEASLFFVNIEHDDEKDDYAEDLIQGVFFTGTPLKS